MKEVITEMKTLHTSGVYRQCLENLRQKRNKKANYSKLDFTIIVLEQLFEHSKESEVMKPTIKCECESCWIDLDSIGHGLYIGNDPEHGYLYPMEESGGYDLENGCPLDEADDLSVLSKEDATAVDIYRNILRKGGDN
jgi:hypothetical protein